MKNRCLFLFLPIFFFLVACAPTQIKLGDYFQPEAKSFVAGMANVYIYNPNEEPKSDQPILYLDDTAVVKLPSRTYTFLHVEEGNYNVSIQDESVVLEQVSLGKGPVTKIKEIYLAAGRNYYLRYERQMVPVVYPSPLGGMTVDTGVAKRNVNVFDSYTQASAIGMCRAVTPFATMIYKH